MIVKKMTSSYLHNIKRLFSFSLGIFVAISANAGDMNVANHNFEAKSLVSVNESLKKSISSKRKTVSGNM